MIKYYLEQQLPSGQTWRSEPHQASEEREIVRAVVAAYLAGYGTRAVLEDGTVVYSITASGLPGSWS